MEEIGSFKRKLCIKIVTWAVYLKGPHSLHFPPLYTPLPNSVSCKQTPRFISCSARILFPYSVYKTVFSAMCGILFAFLSLQQLDLVFCFVLFLAALLR